MFVVIPSQPELHGEGNRHCCAHALEDLLDRGQITQQAAATVAVDDALGRASQVEVNEIEACIRTDARALGERLGIGAEDLRGDRVLVVVVGEVAFALGLAHAAEAVGRGELGHDEAAARDLVRRLDVDVAHCALWRIE